MKDVSKQRIDIENELRSFDSEYLRESQENYEDKMTITKDKQFEILDNSRHTLEVKLMEDLLKSKEIETKEYEDARG